MTTHRSSFLRFLVLGLAAQAWLLSGLAAQAVYYEAETVGGSNDVFANAEDCRGLGSYFLINGTSHSPGNPNSDDEWYQFDGVAGACLVLDFNITQVSTAASPYQLNVWLYNSSQTMVAAWNTVSAVSSASFGIGPFTLPATDTYYVYVTEWSVAPNTLVQPGLTFVPLSLRGFAVNGATPNSTRNTLGGNQVGGTRYTISIRMSEGNDAPFDVWIDRNLTTGALAASPSPSNVCWMPSGAQVRFLASPKCPPSGVLVNISGGGSGFALPGTVLVLGTPGPEISTTYTIDDGAGPQLGGTIQAFQSLVARGGQAVSTVTLCAGVQVCLDVCAPIGSVYLAALSETLAPSPLPVPPFLTPFELDTNSFLFNATFPVNQLAPILTGSPGQAGVTQICLFLPPGLIGSPGTVHMQVATATSGLSGLTPRVALNLIP